jgi:selenide,water dikinase
MYQKGETTGSNQPNRKLVEGFWENASKRSVHEEELLFDPQTSGGLLLSVPNSQADKLVTALKAAGVDAAARIGDVLDDDQGFVRVV